MFALLSQTAVVDSELNFASFLSDVKASRFKTVAVRWDNNVGRSFASKRAATAGTAKSMLRHGSCGRCSVTKADVVSQAWQKESSERVVVTSATVAKATMPGVSFVNVSNQLLNKLRE